MSRGGWRLLRWPSQTFDLRTFGWMQPDDPDWATTYYSDFDPEFRRIAVTNTKAGTSIRRVALALRILAKSPDCRIWLARPYPAGRMMVDFSHLEASAAIGSRYGKWTLLSHG